MIKIFNMSKVIFKEWTCIIEFGEYGNGNTALTLIDENDGEPVAVATVNIVEEEIPKGFVAIKNYSENEGILDALIEHGIVGKPVSFIGNIGAPLCKLLVSAD